jgi:hypothetical protein
MGGGGDIGRGYGGGMLETSLGLCRGVKLEIELGEACALPIYGKMYLHTMNTLVWSPSDELL